MSRKADTKQRVFDKCPHCGRELSPWEKVLLSVDRALMCKHCWYRILVDADGAPNTEPPHESPTKDRKP